MALNHDSLQAALSAAFRTNFKKGAAESWSSDQAADAMAKAVADAVHAYVGAAQVKGVTAEVRDAGNAVIGSSLQTGAVNLS
jgi:hypothetical protein